MESVDRRRLSPHRALRSYACRRALREVSSPRTGGLETAKPFEWKASDAIMRRIAFAEDAGLGLNDGAELVVTETDGGRTLRIRKA